MLAKCQCQFVNWQNRSIINKIFCRLNWISTMFFYCIIQYSGSTQMFIINVKCVRCVVDSKNPHPTKWNHVKTVRHHTTKIPNQFFWIVCLIQFLIDLWNLLSVTWKMLFTTKFHKLRNVNIIVVMGANDWNFTIISTHRRTS